MVLPHYNHFGGRHTESANLKNILCYFDFKNPITDKPISEAVCFGIAGGIAAGYSFCPSIPGYDMGSGIAVIGRTLMYDTSGKFYRDFLDRIGADIDLRETGGSKAALTNVKESLAEGLPAVVWSSTMNLLHVGWASAMGMYTLVVYGIDEDKDVALVADRGGDGFALSLQQLTDMRAKVCSHKNRSVSFRAPIKLSANRFKQALTDGIKSTIDNFENPKIKTFGPPGLLEWSRVITSVRNKKGWPVVYPQGKLYGALRDVYDSIETGGTGGGLYRYLYADYLEEASEYLSNTALAKAAVQYKNLGQEWTGFANDVLPDNIKPFKETKKLLRKKNSLIQNEGLKAADKIEKENQKLRDLQAKMEKHFPLDDDQVGEHLLMMQTRVKELHDQEMDVAETLAHAIR